MPTDPFLPEGRQFPRARSPDAGGSERKRRRKVLSCYDCRRRKLQCDRALPACSRCTKAGQASNCLYIEDAQQEAPLRDLDVVTPHRPHGKLPPFYGHSTRSTATTAPSGDLLSRLEYQDGRVKQLEAALVKAAQGKAIHLPLSPESLTGGDAIAPVQDRETTLLRGKSFKTQFHGNTHPGALIARMPELNGFTRETFEQFPALSRIKEDMAGLEQRTDYAGSKHGAVSDDDLRALIPPKADSDQLIQLYLDNYGGLYHVFHLPSFWKEYTDMWNDGPQSVSPHFAALALCMMSAAQCLTTTSPWLYRANSSVAREKAVEWISTVDDWLLSQSQKHVSATDFQIRVVLLVAKQVAARKFKRTWTDCGDVLRFCMSAGLHRTPDLIRKPTSVLDKELRKRVWAAITELELQASFDRGMVSVPWSLQSDCPGPVHISDDDIDQESTSLPALRRMNEFVNTSYLCLASSSHHLRATLNTYLNNIRQPVSFEEAKRYTDEIEAYLQAIPEGWTSPSSEISKALLSINLRQYMLVLHDRQIRTAESKSERDFSRMVLVETATKMLTAHKSLTSRGCYALELLCYDQLRAALSLCHISATNPYNDDALKVVIDDAAFRLVPEAIEMLTDKVIRFGREQRQLWIMLAAYGYMKSKKDPARRTVYMQETVDKITRPYYKIMACQADDPSTDARGQLPVSTATTEAPDRAAPSTKHDVQNNLAFYASATIPPVPLAESTAMLDLDEIAAWTFDDWSFNPDDLAAMDMYSPSLITGPQQQSGAPFTTPRTGYDGSANGV